MIKKPKKPLVKARKKTLSKARKKPSTKVGEVLKEYKVGKLHSGSKKGPVVKSKKQALAIALNQSGITKKKRKK